MNKTTSVAPLLRLRLLVATLGERLAAPWWRTDFLSPTGIRIGQRIFPRSFASAALDSVTVAACRDHDANTGRRSFHLFRFPAQVEHLLNYAAHQIRQWEIPRDEESLMTELAAITSATMNSSAASGPKSLGLVSKLQEPSIPSLLASLYLDAARMGNRVYPYFEAVDDE